MMPHFHKIGTGCNVAPLVAQIGEHPELWNQHNVRKVSAGSPHAEMDDIWLRYNRYERFCGDRSTFNDEHVPVWYPAARVLTAARPILFGIMAAVQGEMLCGVFITRIPPGGKILRHIDRGWHAEATDKFYVALKSPAGSAFHCDHDGEAESIYPEIGDIHMFDNRKLHWVTNDSDHEKMTLIVAIKTEMFGRV
jgi:hypothetical protein